VNNSPPEAAYKDNQVILLLANEPEFLSLVKWARRSTAIKYVDSFMTMADKSQD
jgi:hypothetical protein